MRELKSPDVESEATANLHIIVRSRDVDSLRRAIDRIAAAAHDPALFAAQPAHDLDDWASAVLEEVDEVGGSVEVRYAIGPPVAMPPVAMPAAGAPAMAMPDAEPVASYRSERPVEPLSPLRRVTPVVDPLPASPAPPSSGPRLTFFDAPSTTRVDSPPASVRDSDYEPEAWPDHRDAPDTDDSSSDAAPMPVDLTPLAAEPPFVSEAGALPLADTHLPLVHDDADDEREPRTTWLHLIPWGAAGLIAIAALVALVWLWPTTPTLDTTIPLDQDIPVDANEVLPAPLQTGASVPPTPLAADEPAVTATAAVDAPASQAVAEAPLAPGRSGAPAGSNTAAVPSDVNGTATLAPDARGQETASRATTQPEPPPPLSPAAVRPPAPRPSASAVAAAEPASPPTAPAPSSFVGVLEVVSTPPGAAVAVNNRSVGKTPLVLSDFPAGTYAVRVELPGFQRWSKAILVGTGQRASVEAILRATP